MPPTSRPPDDVYDALTLGSLLHPNARRDLADLNRQYLELGLTPELAEDPRFRWSEAVRRCLHETDAATRSRMADCPFALFELHLPPDAERASARPGRVEDGIPPAISPVAASRCLSFTHVALFLAWRLADRAPLAARIALGLSAAAELQLNEMCPSQLAVVATLPDLLRPRWPAHERFWKALTGAAGCDAPLALQRVHCHGICLMDTGQEAPPCPPRDPGARRRGRR